MLNRHPDIAISPETDFNHYVYSRRRSLGSLRLAPNCDPASVLPWYRRAEESVTTERLGKFDFYRFLAGLRSPRFAFCAFPLHVLYFLCGSAGFAAGLATHQYEPWTGRVPAQEPAPQPISVEPPGAAAESVATNT